jgi:murein DD-endopeptidase MepM/ murein hydrolase activator NlpD
MPYKRLWMTALMAALCACSTYRKQSSGYRVASDYNRGPASEIPIETSSFPYNPRGPFQVMWPVRKVKLNRGFRPGSDPNHEGIDLGGKRGSEILSAHEGQVIYTGSDFRGYGKMVLVEYNSEWATLYAHLNSIDVRPGQVLQAGELLGRMGATGHATGVHLHFELLHDRKPIDPLPYITRTSRFARAQ